MDQQTQTIVLAVLGIVIAGVIAFVWSSLRAIRTASRRKFQPQRPADQRSYDCECPPYQRDRCVPARVSVPDQTPVAIYGVRTGDACCSGDGRLSQDQVQQIVDRANRLQAEARDRDLSKLLAKLGGDQTL